MIDKIIDMKVDLSKKELLEKLGMAFDLAIERRKVSKNDIEKIFRKYINKYFEMV